METIDEVTMLTNTTRVKHKESEDEDMLSDLPDCVLLHILSLLDTKYAVQTCILSSRWKHLWKRLPTLILRTFESSTCSFTKLFSTCNSFTKFVSRVLSRRDGSIALYALEFDRTSYVESPLLKRIVKYAVSHNVQRLGLSVLCDIEDIPPCLFSSQTLTHLKLSVCPRGFGNTLFPNNLNLPALTCLHLEFFAFCAGDNGCVDPFSTFNRLNSLVIYSCYVKDAPTLCISSATLVNFTMHSHSRYFYKIELCTPCLCNFAFSGTPCQQLCGSNLSCVKQVDIDVDSYYKRLPFLLLTWLLELDNVKSLTVSASILQALYLYPDDLWKLKLPSLRNLTSLKVKMKPLEYGFCVALRDAQLQKAAAKSRKEAAKLRKAFRATGLEPSPPLPDGIVDFLLRNSPSAKVNIIAPKTEEETPDQFKFMNVDLTAMSIAMSSSTMQS